jgi:hypothetical protein
MMDSVVGTNVLVFARHAHCISSMAINIIEAAVLGLPRQPRQAMDGAFPFSFPYRDLFSASSRSARSILQSTFELTRFQHRWRHGFAPTSQQRPPNIWRHRSDPCMRRAEAQSAFRRRSPLDPASTPPPQQLVRVSASRVSVMDPGWQLATTPFVPGGFVRQHRRTLVISREIPCRRAISEPHHG